MKRADGVEVVQVALRLPRQMKKQIVDAAWSNRRSVNAEILCRLDCTLETDGIPASLEARDERYGEAAA